MPDNPKERDDEWTRVWDARLAALTPILGQPGESVFHAVIPSEIGGAADVIPFPSYVHGMTYVTAELTGPGSAQHPTSLGNYELMICTRQELQAAAEFISNLASYTCQAKVEAGETMDIETFFADSTLRAVLFSHPGEYPVYFEFLGQRYGLLLCIGITAEELAFKQANGSQKLLALLRQHEIFPHTIPDRPSVPLPRGGSFLGRMFGR